MTTKKNLHEGGFTLIESMAALVILGVTIAYSMPVLLYSHIKIATSIQLAGALVVAENIVSDIGSRKINSLPVGGTPVVITDPILLTYSGRIYEADVTYCPLPVLEKIPVDLGCVNRPDYREATVRISYKGHLVYSFQAAFSDRR